MNQPTPRKSRVTSLLFLMALSLGVAAYDYHFCRDEFERPMRMPVTAQDEPVKPTDSRASL